ncbi:hypothetical protein BDZ97DRAFT_1791813 [Flammula alnicola]|nr:hypothetical protein BDZ97DRAFT_1791813 [Flammula alnicola]
MHLDANVGGLNACIIPLAFHLHTFLVPFFHPLFFFCAPRYLSFFARILASFRVYLLRIYRYCFYEAF